MPPFAPNLSARASMLLRQTHQIDFFTVWKYAKFHLISINAVRQGAARIKNRKDQIFKLIKVLLNSEWIRTHTHTPFEKQNERKKRKQFARRTSFRRNLIGFALVIVRRKKTEKKQTHQRIIFAFHWNHDDDDNVTTCHCINGESLWVP